jgi:uncharacterized protein YqjF (DUF2071 family)
MRPHYHDPNPSVYDRLTARSEPEGIPVLHQDWLDQLFLHWAVDADHLQDLLPSDVTLDLFNGKAWIGITPFRIENTSPGIGPHWSFVPAFHELNVRTYVYREGMPGVWFFSLDAESQMAAWAAKIGYRLPYLHAHIESRQSGNRIEYRMIRLDEPHAEFECACSVQRRLAPQRPGSFEFFVAERYALFTERDHTLYSARIHHQPWPLYEAHVESVQTTLFATERLPLPIAGPIAHFSPGVNADIWAPKTVRQDRRYH